MTRDRNYARSARRLLEQAERDGLIRWTGEWRNGKKVYVATDAGRAWATGVLTDVPRDRKETS